MSSFPLLRLPSVPLTDALKCLDPIELFTLSQCSTKMIKIIKLAGTRKFKLSADFYDDEITINNEYIFMIYKIDDYNPDDFEMKGNRDFKFKDMNMMVPVAVKLDNENTLSSFWHYNFAGMRAICLHLLHIFDCYFETLFWNRRRILLDYFGTGDDLSFENFQLIIGDILEKQDSIPRLNIWLDKITVENLKWTFDNVKVTEELEIYSKLSEKFVFNFKTLPEVFKVYDSFWFTLENLLSLHSCVVIQLYNSNLTNHDLDLFMNLWKAGSYSKLVYFIVIGNRLNEKKPIGGLTMLKNTRNPIIREKRITGKVYKIFNGVDIESDDGIMATIELHKLDVKNKCFKLLVRTN